MPYSDSYANHSFIKDLSRCVPIAQTVHACKQLSKAPNVVSMPAESFVYEKAISDLTNADVIAIENDVDVFERLIKSKRLIEKGNQYSVDGSCLEYYLARMNAIDSPLIRKAQIVWADYCGLPSYENMKIGKGVKLAFATFTLHRRFYSPSTCLHNRFAKRIMIKSIKSKIRAIKLYYSKHYPDYDLITSFAYVSGKAPMLLIGLAHKSLAFPSQAKCIMQNDGSFITENHENFPKKSLDNFIKRVYRLGNYCGIDCNNYMMNNPKDIMSKNKTKANVKVKKAKTQKKVLYPVLDAMLQNGFSEAEAQKALRLNKNQLRAVKARITMAK